MQKRTEVPSPQTGRQTADTLWCGSTVAGMRHLSVSLSLARSQGRSTTESLVIRGRGIAAQNCRGSESEMGSACTEFTPRRPDERGGSKTRARPIRHLIQNRAANRAAAKCGRRGVLPPTARRHDRHGGMRRVVVTGAKLTAGVVPPTEGVSGRGDAAGKRNSRGQRGESQGTNHRRWVGNPVRVNPTRPELAAVVVAPAVGFTRGREPAGVGIACRK